MNFKLPVSSTESFDLTQRPRRNRISESIRGLVRETRLHPGNFVLPLFIQENSGSTPIHSMPGQFRLGPDALLKEAADAFARGIRAVALFPVISENLKDPKASESKNPKGLLPRTIGILKENLPALTVITDVAMDPYSSDGHDGLVEQGKILNDETLPVLAEMALVQARAGADIIAPSDMMDGRIGYLRKALDENDLRDVGILSYAVKYASAFYGPFRDALDSAPKSGDKKTYQMDPANVREAAREVELDVREGADMVMVKPALPYLDVIAHVRSLVPVPVAAYQVSGEYAMIKAAAKQGWLEEKKAVLETLTSIKRAGADIIFTYFAKDAAAWLVRSQD
ncbi:MAG: delta-aminolevulinic acid dehydratase [Omnitrophica bacterium GWA2_52_8]|nr:MAG: delta-aminolevulinic acid dehydratase [Omnitrophica bacterium GWA2_52_8]